MRKRQRFVLTAILLSIGIWLIQTATLEWRYILTGLLTCLTWVLSAWSLREGLTGIEWLTVLLPLPLFTAGVGLFFILLPSYWIAKMAVVILFGLGQYALLLSANIFSVAAIRTIALLRAAQTVHSIMALVTGFFIFDTILSLRMGGGVVGLLVFLTAFLIVFPSLWTVELLPILDKRILTYSLLSGFLLGSLGIAITVWPLSISVAALFLTSGLYVYLGIIQNYLGQKLFLRTIWEYVTVGLVVLVTALSTILM